MSTIAHPLTLAEEAYRSLRDMVLRRELKPGSWLRQRDVAKRLGVSPTPLVEAFRRLAQEGLLEYVPQWGVRVRALAVRELEQVFHMRLALESITCREVAHRAVELRADLEDLRPLAERVDQAIVSGSYGDRGIAHPGVPNPDDWQFHLRLARLSQMDLVVREIERLWLLPATTLALTGHESLTTPHVELLEAVMSGDADRAEQAIRGHLEPKIRRVLPELRQRFGDGPVIFDEEPEAPAADPDAAFN